MSPEADRREPAAPSRSGGPSGDPATRTAATGEPLSEIAQALMVD